MSMAGALRYHFRFITQDNGYVAYKDKADQQAAARNHYLANREKMIRRALAHKKNLVSKIRENVQELKNTTPCADCGVSYPFYVMQFDHVTGKKLFNVADTSQWSSWKRVLLEIEKCEIVCGNCHAERTYRRGLEEFGTSRAS